MDKDGKTIGIMIITMILLAGIVNAFWFTQGKQEFFPNVIEYYNHDMTLGNFLTSSNTSNATAIINSGNHSFDLQANGGGNSEAILRTVDQYNLSDKAIVFSFVIRNVSGNASQANSAAAIGMTNGTSFSTTTPSHVLLISTGDSNYTFSTGTTLLQRVQTNIGTITSNDIVTFEVYSTRTRLYINGRFKAEHLSKIPTTTMWIGGYTVKTVTTNTNESLSIDYIGIRRYK